MSYQEIIKKYFLASNFIVLSSMYLKEYKNKYITTEDIKNYNPGHLGTSTSMNFILANLYYFLNKNNISSQLVIGTGHSGVSVITNNWLNGQLEKQNPKYSRTKEGLNNLIKDFGVKIRSEINPEYPNTIYDGGELGYSLGVAYGYAISNTANVELVPCIIGDGEAETGTICSAWQLPKMLKTKSKVFPIINLNNFKMDSKSYLSYLNNNELYNYFTTMGYDVKIIETHNAKEIEKLVEQMQNSLEYLIHQQNPLLIFKSPKGYTLPYNLENNTKVHKNPFSFNTTLEKLDYLKQMLSIYKEDLFDNNNNLKEEFYNFEIKTPNNKMKNCIIDIPYNNNDINIKILENYLEQFLEDNKSLIFSPDELTSNMLGKLKKHSIEILNENLLQALYQGYTQGGNIGYYISYEGFASIISSMITQYYKYLKQNEESYSNKELNSLNYILTSTNLENTYSHQNPDFINALIEKDDRYYNIYYPKDGVNMINCIKEGMLSKNSINVYIKSKRHITKYQEFENSTTIQTIVDCDNPDLVLGVTGDYMLDTAIKVKEKLADYNIYVKINYITNPKILDINSKQALSKEEFEQYFTKNIPIIYLYSGYPNVIKSLLFDRNVKVQILGYNDGISKQGNLNSNLIANNLSVQDITEKCIKRIRRKTNE